MGTKLNHFLAFGGTHSVSVVIRRMICGREIYPWM